MSRTLGSSQSLSNPPKQPGLGITFERRDCLRACFENGPVTPREGTRPYRKHAMAAQL